MVVYANWTNDRNKSGGHLMANLSTDKCHLLCFFGSRHIILVITAFASAVWGEGGRLALPMPVPSPDKSGGGTVEWLTVKSK